MGLGKWLKVKGFEEDRFLKGVSQKNQKFLDPLLLWFDPMPLSIRSLCKAFPWTLCFQVLGQNPNHPSCLDSGQWWWYLPDYFSSYQWHFLQIQKNEFARQQIRVEFFSEWAGVVDFTAQRVRGGTQRSTPGQHRGGNVGFAQLFQLRHISRVCNFHRFTHETLHGLGFAHR